MQDGSDAALRDKLRAEIMAASWSELVYQFARGGLLVLAPGLDLLEVATAIALDAREQVSDWVASNALWRANEDDARRFQADSALTFQFVIVQPWVLAQPLHARAATSRES